MPRKSISHHVLKATGKLGKNQRRRLHEVISDQRDLYNSAPVLLETTHAAGK